MDNDYKICPANFKMGYSVWENFWYILSKDLEKATVDVSVNLYSVVVSLPGISHCLVWFLPKIIELLIELKLIINLIEKIGRLI